jgi:succinate-acetate transporter protein
MNEQDKSKDNVGYASEEKKLKEDYATTQYYDYSLEYIKRLVQKFIYTAIIVNRLDYYANAIPLGAFCNAIAFILYGFYLCGIFDNDTFLLGLILLFGGLGQITAGFFEFLKGRSFPATLYLTYGFYCLSLYASYIIPIKFRDFGIFGINEDRGSLAFFYGSWFFISIPIVICSIKTNAFFLLQSLCTLLFYFFTFVGEIVPRDSDKEKHFKALRGKVAGIFEIIAGFVSLYICMNQLINEQFRKQILPSFPLTPDNEIDIIDESQYMTPQ